MQSQYLVAKRSWSTSALGPALPSGLDTEMEWRREYSRTLTLTDSGPVLRAFLPILLVSGYADSAALEATMGSALFWRKFVRGALHVFRDCTLFRRAATLCQRRSYQPDTNRLLQLPYFRKTAHW
jgi:hypothetical protein